MTKFHLFLYAANNERLNRSFGYDFNGVISEESADHSEKIYYAIQPMSNFSLFAPFNKRLIIFRIRENITASIVMKGITMNYRERFLNIFYGKPVDRLPFVDVSRYHMARENSDWNRYLKEDEDPRHLYGFDNAGCRFFYENVPVDWSAVPRFEEIGLPPDGKYKYRRDGSFGRVMRFIPPPPGSTIRIREFLDHYVKTRDDWLEARTHFIPSSDGRLPEDWNGWCRYSLTAEHPIAFLVKDPATFISGLLGLDGDTGMYMSLFDRPALIREMAGQFHELNLACAEKVFREAKVDMLSMGSGIIKQIGPKLAEEFFFDFDKELIELAKSHGIHIICLQTYKTPLSLVDAYFKMGINSLYGPVETGDDNFWDEVFERYGDKLFYIGSIDARVLTRDKKSIEEEIDKKLDLAKRYRMISCLNVNNMIPTVPYENYRHFVQYLKKAIMI